MLGSGPHVVAAGSIQWTLVSLAAGNPRYGRNSFRRAYRALGGEERARIISRITSPAAFSRGTGTRVLDDRGWRRIRFVLDSHCRVTETAGTMVTGLDALFLEVNNLEESLSFYRDQLGLDLESHNSDAEPPMATVRAGALKINLVQQLETMLKRGRGVHFVLGVEDVDALFAKISAVDNRVQSPCDEGWGGRFISVLDPDSYRLVLVEWNANQPN